MVVFLLCDFFCIGVCLDVVQYVIEQVVFLIVEIGEQVVDLLCVLVEQLYCECFVCSGEMYVDLVFVVWIGVVFQQCILCQVVEQFGDGGVGYVGVFGELVW